ncbi:MAG: hypothetical protein LKI17_06885 [Megasphaera cerevisiae]|jgi:hypothetical protein|nr:hypothetical protein [Megasphaera cerevisiae]
MMIIDMRLNNIKDIVNEKDFQKNIEQSEVPLDKDFYKFQDAFDGVSNDMLYSSGLKEDRQAFIEEIEQSFKKYEADSWTYVREVCRVYDTGILTSSMNSRCQKVLNSNQDEWFRWVSNIPYLGIQNMFLYNAPSLQCLTSFLTFIQVSNLQGEKAERLVILILMTYMDKLMRIDQNIRWQNRQSDRKFTWDNTKWEQESSEYIKGFVKKFCEFPKKMLLSIICSVLSNVWIVDGEKKKYEFQMRNEIVEQIATKYTQEDDIEFIIKKLPWKQGKSAVFHRLLLYTEWDTNLQIDLHTYHTVLWNMVIKWLSRKDTYIYFYTNHKNDDLLLMWLCGKLLADADDTMGQIKSMESKYDKRIDGWQYDADQTYHMKIEQYFFLSVGAMAAEWMNKYDHSLAREIFWHIFEKGQTAIYNYHCESENELDFLKQLWSRYSLFITEPVSDADRDKLLRAFRLMRNMQYKLISLRVLLLNLDKKQKCYLFQKSFNEAILKILDDEMEFIQYRNEKFDKDLEEIVKSYEYVKNELAL